MVEQLKVLYLSPEAVPFAKTGGLADVAGSLPGALKHLGVDIRTVMPLYEMVDPEAQEYVRECLDRVVRGAERQDYDTVYHEQSVRRTGAKLAVRSPRRADRRGSRAGRPRESALAPSRSGTPAVATRPGARRNRRSCRKLADRDREADRPNRG